jgi:hypothetical protein
MLSSCKSLVKGLGALSLGGAVLWQVYSHCGSTKGVAYVHVTTPGVGVTVTVDDQTYRVETLWQTPIVCELSPGRHLLRMIRSGLVLFEQEFTLDPGQEVVLTAWERPRGSDPFIRLPPCPVGRCSETAHALPRDSAQARPTCGDRPITP